MRSDTQLQLTVYPNVFTPNNDGINDDFYIDTLVDNCIIYDRWGIEQAQFNNTKVIWDGTNPSGQKASPGIYYYVLVIRSQSKKGFVELIR
jgi:gliding motility-associated-like protein